MSDLEVRIKELETKLDQVTKAYSQELLQIKTSIFQMSNRFEGFLRYLITSKALTMDQFLFALEEYHRFKNKITSLAKEKPNVIDRINDAAAYNENAIFKLYADDIDVISQIEAAGGTAPQTAELITEKLPSTDRLKMYLRRYLVQVPVTHPEPGPDGIVVSTDLKKESEN